MDTDRLIGLAGLALAFIGIPLAFYFARKGRQRPQLRYVSDFDVLMSPERGVAREALKIAYGDRNISQVSRTYLAIWNHRGDTVLGADVVEHDPLRVQLADGDEVLQVELLSTSRETCKVAVSLDPDRASRATISFDFLDQGDGAVLEVLHAGSETAQIAGTVRGAKISLKSASVDLSPRVLDMVAERSLVARIVFRPDVGRQASRLSLRRLNPIAPAAVVNFGLGGFVLLDLLRGLLRPASLVSVEPSTLRTIHGQVEFAKAVRAANPDSAFVTNLWILAAIAAALLLAQLWFFLWLVRIRFPRSLIAHRYYNSLQASTTQA